MVQFPAYARKYGDNKIWWEGMTLKAGQSVLDGEAAFARLSFVEQTCIRQPRW